MLRNLITIENTLKAKNAILVIIENRQQAPEQILGGLSCLELLFMLCQSFHQRAIQLAIEVLVDRQVIVCILIALVCHTIPKHGSKRIIHPQVQIKTLEEEQQIMHSAKLSKFFLHHNMSLTFHAAIQIFNFTA